MASSPGGQGAVAITGAARGIGRATAHAFLAEGRSVAIGDLDSKLAERTAAELDTLYRGRVVGLALDVTSRDSFTTFLDVAEARLGSLEVLVNNAGIMPTGLLSDETDEMTDRIIAVNLRAVITGCKLAVERFSARNSGSIVNIASAAGRFGAPALATYTATKAGVLMFTESLQHELSGSGIHAMAVLPGVVRTELSAGALYPDWMRWVVEIEPEQVADAIVDGVEHRRSQVFSPTSLGRALDAAALLPTPLRRRAERLCGLDTAFTHADPEARARYAERIGGGA